jgi:prepilin-type processing-associated H-X9-DG protein
MCKTRGLTVAEALIVGVVIAILLVFLITAHMREREQSRRTRCWNNLNQLAKGMAGYMGWGEPWYPCPLGRGSDPKSYNGAEWIASLYWTGTVPDPGVFICPSSGDTNHNGVDMGATRTTATFGSQTVSYAGMHWYSVTASGGAVRDDFPPNEAMASDDTQGTINHGTRTNGGMSVLFFDAHVEFKTSEEIDVERAVGQQDGLLTRLKN